MTTSIPLINLSISEAECVEQIRQACTQCGFFYIVNHGVPDDVIDNQFKQIKSFFNLELKEKQKILVNSAQKGYTPYKEQKLDPENQSTGDLKEGLYFVKEVDVGDNERYSNNSLYAPNQWPNESVVPGFRSTSELYMHSLAQLGYKLLKLLALSLDLSPDYFDSMFDHPLFTMRPLHYLEDISVPQEGKFGAGAHTDWGVLTILATDSVPGLQIFYENEWIDVPHVENAFVINLGDMVVRLTNGKYKSSLHRVVKKTSQERYSIPFFMDPNLDAIIECLPQCVGEEGVKFEAISVEQYFMNKLATTHALFKENLS